MTSTALLTAVFLVACGGSPAPPAAPPEREVRAAEHAPEQCGPESAYEGGTTLVTDDGARIFYRVAGPEHAPVVVYLHGGPGYNAYAFERLEGPSLEETFRVVYFDQRGCGRSAASAFGLEATTNDVEALRRAIGAERIALVAHSFGGLVAESYARRFPASTLAVIMIETTPHVAAAIAHQVHTLVEERARFPGHEARLAEIGASSADSFDRLMEAYQELGRLPVQRVLQYTSDEAQAANEALDARSGLMGCTSPGVLSAYRSEGLLAPRDRVGALGVPTLVLAGSESQVVGRTLSADAAAEWGGELLEIPGVGHFPYVERPGAIALATVEFVMRLEPE